jgi:release factor glutamine methyltransferase
MPANLQSLLDQSAARLGPHPNARRDAQLLLLRTLQRNQAWLLTHADETLTPAQLAQFEAWLGRRASHEPIQYILGEQEFYSLTFRVTPDVLIPRPETEHLVEAALQRIPSDAPVQIADIGTGSGAIAVALAHHRPQARITATDTSATALAIARENAQRHHAADRIHFLESDLLAALPGRRFFAIVSNPPYVAASETLEPQVRDYEPHAALFAGPTGLEIYQRLIPQAWQSLVPSGWLLLEIGHDQQPALADLLTGWDDVAFLPDLQGIPRVAIARRAI